MSVCSIRRCAVLLVLLTLVYPSAALCQEVRLEPDVRLVHDRGSSELRVQLHSAAGGKVALTAEILDPQDEVVARCERRATLVAGDREVSCRLPQLDRLDEDQWADLPWYRLHYRITAAGQDAPLADEVVSVSAVAPDAATLVIAAPESVRAGSKIQVRVAARQVQTGELLPGVALALRLEELWLEDPDEPLEWTVRTGDDGIALTELTIPDTVELEDGELIASYASGPFRDEQGLDISVSDELEISLATDKPIYQPGQSVHYRAIVRDVSRQALAGAAAVFTVTDKESRPLHRQELTTSEHGIVHGEWLIPEEAELGSYRLALEVEAQLSGDVFDREISVWVSRYELPTFNARVEPDQDFYLPGEHARVQVIAETLAGQPIAGATVELVEDESSGLWSPFSQEYDRPEGEKVLWRGLTAADGRCTAEVDLAEAHSELPSSSRFRDLDYLVRVTDPASGRQTERRISLRVSCEPVHVYLNQTFGSEELPLELWITTFSAGGEPVACSVELRDEDAEESAPPLATLRTNRYGLTRLQLPAGEVDEDCELQAVAISADGLRGSASRSVWYEEDGTCRVRAAKVLLAPGEPIELQIWGAGHYERLVLEIDMGEVRHSWQYVPLVDGAAELVVPYDERFRGEVSLSVFPELDSLSSEEIDDGVALRSSTIVVYPDQLGLSLAVAVDPTAARPGDPVTLACTALQDNGEPASAALGVVVLDTAVERLLEEMGNADAVSYFNATSRRSLQGWVDSFAGISRDSLPMLVPGQVDDDLELVAELFATLDSREQGLAAVDHWWRASELYQDRCESEVKPVIKAMLPRFTEERRKYPESRDELLAFWEQTGAEPLPADPWGQPYFLDIATWTGHYSLKLISSGPDRQADTDDDLIITASDWNWVTWQCACIDRAFRDHHRDTGAWITSESELLELVRQLDIGWDRLRDPWGSPPRLALSVEGARLRIAVHSSGPDQRWDEQDGQRSWDDVSSVCSSIDTFAPFEDAIENALTSWLRQGNDLSGSEEALQEVMRIAEIPRSELVDPYGNPYYLWIEPRSRYRDLTQVSVTAEGARTVSTPVLERYYLVTVRSPGRDGVQRTDDDVKVHSYDSRDLEVQVVAETVEPTETSAGAVIEVDERFGAVAGIVTHRDAPLPGVTITLSGVGPGTWSTVSDARGCYALRLPPGVYQLTTSLEIFETLEVTVSVHAHEVTRVDLSIPLQEVTEEYVDEITVIEGPVARFLASEVSIAGSESPRAADPATSEAPPFQTPRLRKEFPETLLWEPELLTGEDGRAELPFTLADAVTTWKVQAVASTRDGRFATAETRLVASLPFYLELDLPQQLTRGDVIDLPVLVRNYTSGEQQVRVSLETGDGLEPATATTSMASETTVRVEPGAAGRATFPVRAAETADEISVKATGVSEEAGDAVQRSLAVRPFGEEVRRTLSVVVRDDTRLPVEIPQQVLPGTTRATLRIFPNLAAHLRESMEGILQRPAGCGEQVVSTAWVSLLLLEHLERSDLHDTELERKATSAVATGVFLLNELHTKDGGYSFWRGGKPDQLLTAYALRFLARAAKRVEVDEQQLTAAVRWLLSRQGADGAWHEESEGQPDDSFIQDTAFIVRALAEAGLDQASSAAVGRALDLLEPLLRSFDEPLALASFVLACAERPDHEEALGWARQRLAGLVEHEGDVASWQVLRNTPLLGWGLPGRLETTAVAVTALGTPYGELQELRDAGLLYLLRNKDPYSVWFSTQATVAALEAMVSVGLGSGGTAGELLIQLPGEPEIVVPVPEGSKPAPAITVELPITGSGELQLRRSGGTALLVAELQLRYYHPWPDQELSSQQLGNLAFSVSYDRQQVVVGEEISCTVRAERVARRGRGMLLAEVGLPPGAEVDRAGLERQLGWWDSFEIQPDRVVLYLWARPGGTELSFSFTPRFAGDMRSTASTLADYYNPESRVVLPPRSFVLEPR